MSECYIFANMNTGRINPVLCPVCHKPKRPGQPLVRMDRVRLLIDFNYNDIFLILILSSIHDLISILFNDFHWKYLRNLFWSST